MFYFGLDCALIEDEILHEGCTVKVNVCAGSCWDTHADASTGEVYNFACMIPAGCFVTKKTHKKLTCIDGNGKYLR